MTCCKDCESRYPGCHDHCGIYKNEKAEHERRKELARKNESYHQYVLENRFRCMYEDALRKKKQTGYDMFKGRK